MFDTVIRGVRTATHWVRFTWELDRLPAEPVPLSPRYGVRPAEDREDRAAVWKVIADSLALDPAWNETFNEVQPMLRTQTDEVFEVLHGHRPETVCLALTHGARIIGVSVFTPESDAENHLLTGPCVFMEYRNRGLGTCLLDRTLRALREAGLSRVHGVTKRGTGAAKFVYPKFAGHLAEFELEALLAVS